MTTHRMPRPLSLCCCLNRVLMTAVTHSPQQSWLRTIGDCRRQDPGLFHRTNATLLPAPTTGDQGESK